MHCHRSRVFVELFYFVVVISVLASSRLDAASLQLSWIDNSANEDGFHIERKVGTNGIFSFVAAVGPNITSYTDDNLVSNTTYCYRLNAFNDIGISAYTNEACGTTSGGASVPPTPPVPPSNTVVTNITDGAVLSGSFVVWTATPSGSPVRVEFFIDGALSWTENASPYQFNGDPAGALNTNTLSDGSHQLRVRAVYSNNSTAEQAVTVTVSNGASPTPTSPPSSGNSISMNIANNTVLSGSFVVWTATPSGSPARVEFFIDGTLSWTENTSPYQFNGDPSGTLNTNTLSNGSHQLRVRAVYSNSSTAEQTVTVTVSNGASSAISSTIAATLLGQTGEDIAGTTSETPDGIQDVQIRLSGVQGTITQIRITDGGNGVWETPYNGWWIVAIRPHSDPSLVDLYFDFWEPTSAYTVTITFANGTTQAVLTSASLPLQMLGNSP